MKPLTPLVLTLALSAFASNGPSAQEPGRDQLPRQALALVNEERSQRGLPELRLEAELNEAARLHARDMLERDYYAHESPEGENVQDRYLAAGGAKWRLVAENIARCGNCDPVIDEAALQRLHRGWMNSPEHRANILRQGVDRFGFGAAASDTGGLYAVQTFSGPGRPRGLKEGEQAGAIPPGRQVSLASDMINEGRREAGLAPLDHARALRPLASRVLAGGKDALDQDIYAMLPESERTGWARLQLLYARCGGCGEAPTRADVRHFLGEWLGGAGGKSVALEPAFTHFDFAIEANGEGRKDAVLVLGARR